MSDVKISVVDKCRAAIKLNYTDRDDNSILHLTPIVDSPIWDRNTVGNRFHLQLYTFQYWMYQTSIED